MPADSSADSMGVAFELENAGFHCLCVAFSAGRSGNLHSFLPGAFQIYSAVDLAESIPRLLPCF